MIEKNEDFLNGVKNKVKFVTIEIIQNGFVITLPEYAGKSEAKIHRLSLDGVLAFMKKVWGDNDLVEKEEIEKTDTTIEDVLKKKKRKKNGRNS